MQHNKPQALLNALGIRYIAACAEAGDAHRLRDITLSTINRIRSLPTCATSHIEQFPADLIEVKVNKEALERCLSYIDAEQRREEMIDQLIILGARRSFITEFTGLGRREYAFRCQMLGAPSNRGRPAVVNEAEAAIIISSYEEYIRTSTTTDPLSMYYHIATTTKIEVERIRGYLRSVGLEQETGLFHAQTEDQ